MQVNDIIVESMRFIEDNLEEQITLENIASYMGYSKYHFSRIFKIHTGTSVMEYVKKRKLLKASDDIIQGAKIIDVAFKYGFLSHGGFTKAFKQEFGFSPALLRTMILQMDCLGGNAMSHVFMNQTNKSASKEELYEILKNEINQAGMKVDMESLDAIYAFACRSYEGIKRYSGDEYVTHPLNVAIILAQMGAEETVILAGMLCDVLIKTNVTADMLTECIPLKVAEIVIALKEFDVKQMQSIEKEAVIMVKLAERLHNMRTVEYMEEEKKAVKAKETVELFLPIAGKLGNDKLVAELNDLSLKYM